MRKLTHQHTAYLLVFFLYVLDRIGKAVAPSSTDLSIIPNILGWEYFENTGIAFGIPIPLSLIIVGTPILLIFLLQLVKTDVQTRLPWYLLLFLGAISNLVDRIYFGYVIDYIRLFNGVINIADIMILIGLAKLVYSKK